MSYHRHKRCQILTSPDFLTAEVQAPHLGWTNRMYLSCIINQKLGKEVTAENVLWCTWWWQHCSLLLRDGRTRGPRVGRTHIKVQISAMVIVFSPDHHVQRFFQLPVALWHESLYIKQWRKRYKKSRKNEVSWLQEYIWQREVFFYNLQRRTHRHHPPLLLFFLSHSAPSSMGVKTITVFLTRLSQFITTFCLFPFSMAIILDQDVGVLQ